MDTIIKCHKCGQEYIAQNSDLDETDLIYTCECGAKINVSFFDYCPDCKKNVGFLDSDLVSEILIGVAQDFVTGARAAIGDNTLGAVVNLFKSVKMMTTAKESNGDGVCPMCKKRYIRCCDCSCMTTIPLNIEFKNLYKCRDCSTRLIPCGVKNSINAKKHSREFLYSKGDSFYNQDSSNYNTQNYKVGIVGHFNHGKSSLHLLTQNWGLEGVYSNVEYCDYDSYYEAIDAMRYLDGIILVVDATEGPMPQTRNLFLEALHNNVSIIAAYISKCSNCEEELVELVEMEIEELFESQDVYNVPIFKGDTQEAEIGFETDCSNQWTDAYLCLLRKVNNWENDMS